MRWKTLIGLLCCLTLSAQKAPALDPVKDVSVTLRDSSVVVEAPVGAHLKSAFMAVKLKEGTPGSLEVGPLPPTTGQDELKDGIWRGPVVIPVKGRDLPPAVELVVTYQPCTEGEGAICYPPTDQVLKVKGEALAGPSQPEPTRNLLWSFLVVFAFGVAASLTPCVYPMIPITMVVVGAKGGGRLRGFLLSLALVLGMAVTYSALGVLAARSGAAFGAFAQRPAFLIPLSLLFALFALSLLGAFELRLPSALQARLQSGPRKGFLGAFLMGLVLGPISAPCVGPVVGTVLLGIATQGQVLLGALQLFTFALGMGVLFMAVGTFSASLPRSGEWLVTLKKVLGLVALGFAAWNVRLLGPDWLQPALWTIILLLGAGVLGAFRSADGLLASFGKGLGLACLALGVLLGIRAVESGLGLTLLPRAAIQRDQDTEAWRTAWVENDFEGALARAKAERKRLVVDVWAEWCAACKELDEKTWPDPRVAGWLEQNAIAVRVDTDRVRKDLEKSLNILGYPTVLVLDGNGKELHRQVGFQRPEAMLAFLARP